MLRTLVWLGAILIPLSINGGENREAYPVEMNDSLLTLPVPLNDSETSVEQALHARRSVRTYKPAPLSLSEVSQLLWAAQGLTHRAGMRTAPSAGALYPLEIYIVAGDVTNLQAGVYHYNPQVHGLMLVREGDIRPELSEAALRQSAVEDAAIVLIISAEYERTTVKYGQRGIQYVHMEVGHVSQNVYLQAESLGLGTVFIGAFHEDEIRMILRISQEEIPLGLMPVGNTVPAGENAP